MSRDGIPLFSKAQNSMCSAGAFVVEGGDSEFIYVRNEKPMTYDVFLSDFVKNSSYILQEMVRPHSFFEGVTEATPTVRFVNLTSDSGAFTPYAALKLPMGKNVADNLWRDRNLVCSLDIDTGQVQSIVSKQKTSLTQYDSLPNLNRKLIGEVFPLWDELRSLNEKVALLHSQLIVSSTDIAITNDGPVVIEVNIGSDFEMPQVASGKGFLSDEVRDFFVAAGSKLIH